MNRCKNNVHINSWWCRYVSGFVWFVLSLVKRYYMRQFSLFAWTHVALLIVVTQSYLIIQVRIKQFRIKRRLLKPNPFSFRTCLKGSFGSSCPLWWLSWTMSWLICLDSSLARLRWSNWVPRRLGKALLEVDSPLYFFLGDSPISCVNTTTSFVP